MRWVLIIHSLLNLWSIRVKEKLMHSCFVAAALGLLLSAALHGADAGDTIKMDLSGVYRPDMNGYRMTPGMIDAEIGEDDDDEEDEAARRKRGVYKTGFLWPNNQVPYEIDSSIGSRTRKQIMAGIEDFHKTTCVQWRPKQPSDAKWVKFVSKPGKGCARQKFMTTPKEVRLENGVCDQSKGQALHEMMHSVGFNHEHIRSDRDDYIELKRNLIDPSNWDRNYVPIKTSVEDNLGFAYDYESVMHYHPLMGTLRAGVPAIIAKDQRFQSKMGQRSGFGGQDIPKINKLYNCNGATVNGGGGGGAPAGGSSGGSGSDNCRNKSPGCSTVKQSDCTGDAASWIAPMCPGVCNPGCQ